MNILEFGGLLKLFWLCSVNFEHSSSYCIKEICVGKWKWTSQTKSQIKVSVVIPLVWGKNKILVTFQWFASLRVVEELKQLVNCSLWSDTHTHTQILRYSQKYDRRAEKISQWGQKKTPDFAHDRSFLLNK